jgi:putative membrane protein
MKSLKSSLLALCASALIFSATPTAYADNNKAMTGADKMFMQKMAEGNLAEIQCAKLALEKSRNRRVREVAKTLLKGHRQAQQKVYKIASVHQVSLPTQPNATSRAVLNELSGLRGRAFDKAFMAHQVKTHNATMDSLMKAMNDGNDSHSRDYAAAQYGPISDHTAMIYNTAGHFGVPVGATKSATAKRRR